MARVTIMVLGLLVPAQAVASDCATIELKYIGEADGAFLHPVVIQSVVKRCQQNGCINLSGQDLVDLCKSASGYDQSNTKQKWRKTRFSIKEMRPDGRTYLLDTEAMRELTAFVMERAVGGAGQARVALKPVLSFLQ